MYHFADTMFNNDELKELWERERPRELEFLTHFYDANNEYIPHSLGPIIWPSKQYNLDDKQGNCILISKIKQFEQHKLCVYIVSVSVSVEILLFLSIISSCVEWNRCCFI